MKKIITLFLITFFFSLFSENINAEKSNKVETNKVTSDEVSDQLKKLLDLYNCLLYTSPSPRDRQKSRMPSSA